MEYSLLNLTLNTYIQFSEFTLPHGKQYCFIVSPNNNDCYSQQLNSIEEGIEAIYKQFNLTKTNFRFSRIFLSDIYNQKDLLLSSNIFKTYLYKESTSIIEQLPCNGSKIQILLICNTNNNCKTIITDNSLECSENNVSYIWSCNLGSNNSKSIYDETKSILNDYDNFLILKNMNIANNCIRTWFYIRDIDNSYEEMVNARKHYFENIGLTKETHFITSTGIEGNSEKSNSYISFDSLAIKNFDSIQYLYAQDYLNPTHEYGVTFERGIALNFNIYKHILISGTASINNKGEILYLGSIENQIIRTFENIKALLNEANADLSNIFYLIIYIRDVNDSIFIYNFMQKNYSNLPFVLVKGAVCRPGWLIEIECEAYL
jgi:enamine deaminase RidA (YjgF/YER057c/UK114 family)